MKERKRLIATVCSAALFSAYCGAFALLTFGGQFVHAAHLSVATSGTLNPREFGTGHTHIRPLNSQAYAATSLVIDTTLNPMNRGPIPGVANGVGSTYTVSPNYGTTAGANEFFSFQTFNLGTPDTALFQVPNTNIANIISRVTGGGLSSIDGTVVSPVSFWLINPAGFVVGKDAAFNVSGALGLGAADYISFKNGERWYALDSNGTTGNPSVLSTSPPQSYGFLSNSQAGAFTADGLYLSVPGSVTFAGGGLTLTDTAIVEVAGTSSNSINLVAGTADLTLAGATQIITYSFPSSLGGAGDINLTSAGAVNITGPVTIDSSTYYAYKAGNVSINASSMLAGNTSINTYAPGAGPAGGFSIISFSDGPGPAGAININVGTGPLSIYGGYITSTAQKLIPAGYSGPGYSGGGSAASITLTGGSITVVGSSVDSSSSEIGTAGLIQLSAANDISIQHTLVASSAFVATPSSSNNYSPSLTIGGAKGVMVDAGGNISLIDSAAQAHVDGTSTDPNPNASAGFVSLVAGTAGSGDVTLTNSQLDVHSTYAGMGGDVSVHATGAITIAGEPNQYVMGFVDTDTDAVTTQSTNAGIAGRVQITAAGGVTVDNGASISSVATGTIGAAGEVTVAAAAVDLENAQISTTTASGQPSSTRGTITLNAGAGAGALTINNSTLDATTSGAQQAGEIDLKGSSIMVNNSTIQSSTTGTGSAGSICVGEPGCVPAGATVPSTGGNISLSDSTLSTSTAGAGNAGDVSITTGASGSIVLDDVRIDSSASSPTNNPNDHVGNAGSITVTAGGSLLVSSGSLLSALAGFGSNQAGSVQLSAGGSLTLEDSQVGAEVIEGSASTVPSAITISAGGPVAINNVGAATGSEFLSSLSTVTYGAGAAGNIAINSPSTVTISGPNITFGVHADTTSISTETQGSGNAGDIKIIGGSVYVTGDSIIDSNAYASGRAGDILIKAEGPGSSAGPALLVNGGATISSAAEPYATGTANAGTITLSAPDGTVQLSASDPLATTTISTSAISSAGSAGTVTVNAGKAITLAGADIETTAGSLTASGAPATITLAASPGAAPIPVSVSNSTLNASTSGTQAGGEIDLRGSQITISNNTQILSQTTGPSAAGDIKINGSTVNVSGSEASVSTTNSGSAGNVSITASGADQGGMAALQVSGGSIITSDANQGQSGASGPANAGSTTLMASNPQGSVQIGLPGDVTLTTVSSSTGPAAGLAGTVTVNAGKAITLAGADIETTAGSLTASGAPATITLAASHGIGLLDISNSTLNASTSGPQRAGEIDLFGAPTAISNSWISSTTEGTGAAGLICVLTGSEAGCGAPTTFATSAASAANALARSNSVDPPGNITIENSVLRTDATDATGPAAGAGTITVKTAGDVMLTDSALLSTTGSYGPAGAVIVSGADISITGAKAIAGAPPVSISTSTEGNGSSTAGDINVSASNALTLTGVIIESQSTSTSKAAAAPGKIALTGDSVSLTGGSVVSASTVGGPSPAPGTRSDPGAPRAITITSGLSRELLIANSEVTTDALVATGGNIEINAGGSPVFLNNAQVVASASGRGNGGNIAINDAGDMVLQRSEILATTPSGSGGQIDIHGRAFVEDPASRVSADSQNGNNGTVTINSPQTNLNAALQAPAVAVQKTPVLSANACRRDPHRSTFVREGRGGVTPAPDGYLTEVAPPVKPTQGSPPKAADDSDVTDGAGVQFASTVTPELDCR